MCWLYFISYFKSAHGMPQIYIMVIQLLTNASWHVRQPLVDIPTIWLKLAYKVISILILACPWDNDVVANQSYYDNYYRRCTLRIIFLINLVCPSIPSSYADSSSKSCVQYCPSGKFALDTNRSCTSTCPSYYFVN